MSLWKITYGMRDGTGPYSKIVEAAGICLAFMSVKGKDNINSIERVPDDAVAIESVDHSSCETGACRFQAAAEEVVHKELDELYE